ncbi:MAG: co-chaperone GroES [Clostridia bacterium]
MIRCVGKNIIVELSNKNEYEKNGIIIKSSSSSNLIGNVICVGNEVRDIKVGDKVIYSEKDARKIIYESKEYYVLDEKDILAII